MLILMIGVLVLFTILLLAYICFRITFYVTKAQRTIFDEHPIPAGKIYEPWRDTMLKWMQETRALPCQEYHIESDDGLTLYGKFYEYAPGATIELMFHGYRGNAERDLCGGVQRCFALGHSAFVVDQRGSGKSQGNVITFGIREHQDCLKWVDFLINTFGSDTKIILTGISMGAATVLMAAGKPLPKNVVGVLADCGFSSPKEIIKKCAKDQHYPVKLIYPFIKLSAKIFGHFDLEEYSPLEAMKTCKVPVIFFHGEDDDFVPCYMSQKMYDACSSPKRLVTVPKAGHGLVYLVENEKYFQSVVEFFSENGVETKLVK